MRERRTTSEIPVRILRRNRLADHIGRARAREEIVILVGVRAQRGKDRRVHPAQLVGEEVLETEVLQRLVGVVMQEGLDVFGQPERVIERLGIAALDRIKVEDQREGEILDLLPLGRAQPLHPALELVADVIAVHRLVADDEADQIGGVGQPRPARPVHRQVEARVEEEALEEDARHLLLQRLRGGIVFVEDQPRLVLQIRVLLGPAEGLVDLGGRAQRREDRGIGARMHRLHEGDVGQHRLLMRGDRIGHQRGRAHGVLDRVQKRQPGEHPDRQPLLVLGQLRPALDVVRQRHLLGQPEIHRQPVPDLQVLVVLHPVPVDRARHRPPRKILHRLGPFFLAQILRGSGGSAPGRLRSRSPLTASTTRSPAPRSPRGPSAAGGCSRSS
ncbi:hypothetical protein SDC9_45233 [bioreactor metagenome]|uniref:Uncharacterized protein n=1 Tax=bioreactor metagenome TaxID=1076179 RepID=A0A644W6A9_9ZZZZ